MIATLKVLMGVSRPIPSCCYLSIHSFIFYLANKYFLFCFRCGHIGLELIVHGPDRVPPPPPGQSETKFLLFLGPPPISKVDAIKKKLGWTTCFGPFSKWPPSKSGNHVLCHNLSSKAVRVTKLVSIHMFLGTRNLIIPIKNISVL